MLSIVKKLKEDGVTCIYISHKLEEVFSIADTITVIRDGQKIITDSVENFNKTTLIQHMVGRPLGQLYPREEHTPGEVVMEVKNYTVYDESDAVRKRADNISFKIRKGEILGVAGLMGAGRSEMFSSIFGAYFGKREGEIYIKGKKVLNKTPKESIENGYCMLTEDRKVDGLNLIMSVRENITLASLRSISKLTIDESREIVSVNEQINNLLVKTPSPETKAMNLSGGNQQKVVFAKWVLARPDILVIDEPTRGIDVGAKYEIYKIMNKLIDEGIAIVMISSELEEILGMSDRIIVMNEGKLKGEIERIDATQERIMELALT